jgi:hypothetical protein
MEKTSLTLKVIPMLDPNTVLARLSGRLDFSVLERPSGNGSEKRFEILD